MILLAMIKALILTYYWPPAGGSGVQRWLKFVKYLPEYGVQPIVYKPKNPAYPSYDTSLAAEIPNSVRILEHPIYEPQQLVNFFTKKNTANNLKKTASKGLLSWLRGNLFVPDPRVLWVKPSVAYLQQYLNENPVDIIISTGPPHSMHLIGKALSKKNKLPWIADFRDPWTSIYYHNDFQMGARAKKRNARMEASVLAQATTVLTVGESLKASLEAKGGKSVAVISNGHDIDTKNIDFPTLDDTFTISHIGMLPAQSNPIVLWKVLSALCNEIPSFKEDLRIQFVGSYASEIIAQIQQYGLEDSCQDFGYLSHEEAIKRQQSSQLLLLCIPNVANADEILTGKLFEYMCAHRPVLGIGSPIGDAAKCIRETAIGEMFAFDDASSIKKYVQEAYLQYREGTLQVEPKHIEKYSRKQLSEQLAQLLQKTIAHGYRT